MDGISGRHVEGDNGVATFVIGREPLLVLGHDQGAPLRTHHHLVLGVLELVHRDDALATTCGEQCRFVDEVHQVGAGETRGTTRDDLEIDIRSQRHLANVNAKNALAADDVGVRHHDLAVEAARTQQGGVEHVGTVRGRNDDHALVGLEPVHLHEELVQCLLALIVAAAETRAAVATDSVDLIDEDDAGRILLGLLEHVTDAAGTDADEHLDEVRTRDREERHIGFARHRTGNEGLTRAGRADEEHTTRNATAETLELLRITQELHDLLQVFLGFFDAGDVVEADAARGLGEKLGLRLAEAHGAPGTRLHLGGSGKPRHR